MKTNKKSTAVTVTANVTDPVARRKLNKMRNTMERMNYIVISLLIFSVVCIGTTIITFSNHTVVNTEHGNQVAEMEAVIDGLSKSIEDRDKVIAQKESEIELYQNDIVTVVNEYNTLYNDTMALTEMNVQLAKDNEELANKANSDNEELEDLRHRAELYDKYNYAIINQMDPNLPEDQKRTDITYDQIETLEALAAENGLSEDAVALVLSIAMNESRGQEDAKNPNSTATGYCGILNTTGKYLYEDLMGNPAGSYSHDMCYNGYINLELSLQYIKYLNDMYGGDILRVVNGYRGYYDAAYDSQLDANLQRGGKSLYTLSLGGD
jgi:hypothetical protein